MNGDSAPRRSPTMGHTVWRGENNHCHAFAAAFMLVQQLNPITGEAEWVQVEHPGE